MDKKQSQLVLNQKKKLVQNFRKNKEIWIDLFSFLISYKKQMNSLLTSETDEISE